MERKYHIFNFFFRSSKGAQLATLDVLTHHLRPDRLLCLYFAYLVVRQVDREGMLCGSWDHGHIWGSHI